MLSSGIVLTGGSAVMRGMVDLGEEIFHLPVRLGVPAYTGGLADVVKGPRYATAVGLLLEGRDQFLRERELRGHTSGVLGVFERMREWFKANF
jgi:cell division protein FtsA